MFQHQKEEQKMFKHFYNIYHRFYFTSLPYQSFYLILSHTHAHCNKHIAKFVEIINTIFHTTITS